MAKKTQTATSEVQAQVDALAAPFDEAQVKWKPGAISGNRAMALAYIDARLVQDRLDEVVGVANWKDQYEFLPDGSVLCTLHVRLGGEWITKMDVGGASEQPDEGDRRKAAISDALKRAAVKFGVGRYLYRLPAQWCDWDAQRKQFKNRPRLTQSALPAGAPDPTTPQEDAEVQAALRFLGEAKDLPDLQDRFKRLPREMKLHASVTRAKDVLKATLGAQAS